MNQGRIIVITGSPGTGKTTTASIVAKESNMDKSVHMHTDDFFHGPQKGSRATGKQVAEPDLLQWKDQVPALWDQLWAPETSQG